MFDIDKIVRKNIKDLVPYSSARDEFTGKASIWLDANENPFDSGLNRYPDPYQRILKELLSEEKLLQTDQIFIGNGSDEVIDLLFRAFCEPGQDKAYIFTPTYGMYQVSAQINNIALEAIPLTDSFDLPPSNEIAKRIDSKGLLFICSPNNPTGNMISLDRIAEVASIFEGLVVVDEAYIDFANSDSAIRILPKVKNLVVMQTFSKAYGLAGLRVGMSFADPKIISVLNKIKPPYNVNSLSQERVIEALKVADTVQMQISELKDERELLATALRQIDSVMKVFPSEANFLLVEFKNPELIYSALMQQGIVVRNRSKQIRGCLRISIGTPEQNKILINTLKTL